MHPVGCFSLLLGAPIPSSFSRWHLDKGESQCFVMALEPGALVLLLSCGFLLSAGTADLSCPGGLDMQPVPPYSFVDFFFFNPLLGVFLVGSGRVIRFGFFCLFVNEVLGIEPKASGALTTRATTKRDMRC